MPTVYLKMDLPDNLVGCTKFNVYPSSSSGPGTTEAPAGALEATLYANTQKLVVVIASLMRLSEAMLDVNAALGAATAALRPAR